MRELLSEVLVVLGLIYIVAQSTIFHVFRIRIANLGPLAEIGIYCSACVGFWMGGLVELAWHPPSLELLAACVRGCALGALWSVYGPESPYNLERGHDPKEKPNDESEYPEDAR